MERAVRPLTGWIFAGVVTLLLMGAKAPAKREVVRLFQQSIDADRDGQFERLFVSVLLGLPATRSASLLATIESDSGMLVSAWPVGPVGEHASMFGSIPVGAAPAGNRSFRLQFDGEEIRRKLPERGRYFGSGVPSRLSS